MGRRPALQARRAPGQAGGVRCGQGAVAQLRARAGRGGGRLGRARPGDRGAPPRTSPPASPHLPTSLPAPPIRPEQLRRTAPLPPAPSAHPPSRPAAQPSCPPLQGAFYVADLRSAATHCLLCAWFNEYARFSERDQLSFAYVAMSLAAATRVHLIPRRLHWSVTKSTDTTACYGATEADAATIASHHAHTRSDTGRRG